MLVLCMLLSLSSTYALLMTNLNTLITMTQTYIYVWVYCIYKVYCIYNILYRRKRAWPSGCSAFRPSARTSTVILHTNQLALQTKSNLVRKIPCARIARN